MKYRVSEIYPAIQGEGAQAGKPMILVRLQGCSNGCPFCDTPHAQGAGGQEMETEDILGWINKTETSNINWVLLTGGEPTEQDLGELILALQKAGYQVALETSGSSMWAGRPNWICVSPKQSAPALAEALEGADEIKFVIGDENDLLFARQTLERIGLTPIISIQPMDGDNRTEALSLCIKTALETGWSLSIQIHKIIGVK